MVEAIGRGLLAVLALAVLSGCAATDVSAPGNQPSPTAASPTPSPIVSVAAVPPTPPAVRVDTLSEASQAQAGPGAYRYNVQVPQLVGLGPHGPALNGLLRGALQRDLDDFLANAQDAQSPTDLTCTSRTIRLTGKVAVLRVDCTSSEAGVARPTTVVHTFNCDLAGSRILTLQDLFSAGSAYLDVLSNASRSQFPVQATPAADRTVAEATAPVAANFKVFLLDQTGLDIVFPDFQVAPGTAATPLVTIPYGDLQRYFAPGIADLLS
jgi:hypothetical protein